MPRATFLTGCMLFVAPAAAQDAPPYLASLFVAHELGRAGCLEKARAVAAAKGLSTKPNPYAVYMAASGNTIGIMLRCDAPGGVVLIVAGPPAEGAQVLREMEDVRARFVGQAVPPLPAPAPLAVASPAAAATPTPSLVPAPAPPVPPPPVPSPSPSLQPQRVASAPVAAQRRQRIVKVYGDEECPNGSDDEVIVCARLPNSERPAGSVPNPCPPSIAAADRLVAGRLKRVIVKETEALILKDEDIGFPGNFGENEYSTAGLSVFGVKPKAFESTVNDGHVWRVQYTLPGSDLLRYRAVFYSAFSKGGKVSCYLSVQCTWNRDNDEEDDPPGVVNQVRITLAGLKDDEIRVDCYYKHRN